MHVDEEAVRDLIASQFPRWAGLPVRFLPSQATVNAIFRVGPALVARFPLHWAEPASAADSLRAEASAADEFHAVSPFPSPVVVAIGEPGERFPLPWSLQTWIPGCDATVDDPGGSVAFAADLARLIRRLRSADTGGRSFAGTGRGGHLHAHDAWLEQCFTKSVDLLDVPRLRDMWAEFRELPRAEPDAMCHGDLIPPNLLSDGGRLVGVLDCGGFGPADPALDLVVAWHVLDDVAREHFRRELGCDDLQWERGRAWAFAQAMGLVWYYATSNPGMSRWGRRTLDRLSRPLHP